MCPVLYAAMIEDRPQRARSRVDAISDSLFDTRRKEEALARAEEKANKIQKQHVSREESMQRAAQREHAKAPTKACPHQRLGRCSAFSFTSEARLRPCCTFRSFEYAYDHTQVESAGIDCCSTRGEACSFVFDECPYKNHTA